MSYILSYHWILFFRQNAMNIRLLLGYFLPSTRAEQGLLPAPEKTPCEADVNSLKADLKEKRGEMIALMNLLVPECKYFTSHAAMMADDRNHTSPAPPGESNLSS